MSFFYNFEYDGKTKKTSFNSMIGEGGTSRVFKISDSKVIKIFYFFGNDIFGEIGQEFEMAKRVFNSGISSPCPWDLIPVMSSENYETRGIVMDYVPGEIFSSLEEKNISEELWVYINSLKSKEVLKAERLGFVPGDNGLVNTIYDQETDKVTLIDFAKWRFWG